MKKYDTDNIKTILLSFVMFVVQVFAEGAVGDLLSQALSRIVSSVTLRRRFG